MCDDGCAENPCKNGGFCEELWEDQKFKCDCTYSEFAGPRCDTGMNFGFYTPVICNHRLHRVGHSEA